jgi:MinD-like ATPase involved in chromosome partitioning or flagellar assembly
MTQFTFVSGKGGVGQSFLVANLAHALAATGATVATVTVTPSTPGVELVLPQDGLEGLSLVQAEDWTEAAQVSGETDFRLVDAPVGFPAEGLGLAAGQGPLVVVLNPEPASLLSGHRLLRGVVEVAPTCRVGLVVNRADAVQGFRVAQRFQAFVGRHLGCPVRYLGSVQESKAVARSTRSRRLLAQTVARTRALTEIRGVARALTEWPETGSTRPLLDSLSPLEVSAPGRAA